MLVRAGCAGSATTRQPWTETLPKDETLAVIMTNVPPAGLCGDLEDNGYRVTVLVTSRDSHCVTKSQVRKGTASNERAARRHTAMVYREIFTVLPRHVPFFIVPYESLVLHPTAAVAALLEEIGLDAHYLTDPVRIDDHSTPGLTDQNAKYYGQARPEDPTFRRRVQESLVWLPEHGMGYYPVTETPYDDAYFAKYEGYANTGMGLALTAARVRFVAERWAGKVVDVGIGSGSFIEAREKTFGYDINPAGAAWLEDRNLFVDPRYAPFPAATFWDSLEHIPNPRQILDNIEEWVFVSLPIFRDGRHILGSRHFRRDEHCWYWSMDGFIAWMAEAGFAFRDHSSFERDIGRLDIETFSFERETP